MNTSNAFRRNLTIFLIAFAAAACVIYALKYNASGVMKYPVTDPKFDVQMTNFVVNNQFAHFYFDVLDDDADCQKVFRSYSEAMTYAEDNGLVFLPSVQMVNAKCKQFDDGMYAALEKLMESGAGSSPPVKAEFLTGLFNKLLPYYMSDDPGGKSAARTAMIYVGAALYQGGMRSDFDLDIDAAIKSIEPDKPIGFFTWDKELEAIFKQDRILMNGIGRIGNTDDPAESIDHIKAGILISCVVNADATLRKQHGQIIDFYAHMTNPRRHPTVEDYIAIIGARTPVETAMADEALVDTIKKTVIKKYPQLDCPDFSLIPYCFSREDYFVQRMGPLLNWNRQIMEQFIEAIRSGQIDLKPRKNSGWYDYQQYALETLVTTDKSYESQKIEFSAKYKERLEEAFKSILTKQRETHIKNLGVKCESKEVGEGQVGPEFSVEPLATVYLRLARSYLFVEEYLGTSVGWSTLEPVKGLRENREVKMDLKQELEEMVRLMYGLHLLSCQELGLNPNLVAGELDPKDQERAMDAARYWIRDLPDADYTADTRVAVPISWDYASSSGAYVHRYWATAGVRFKRLEYSYKTPPMISGVEYDKAGMTGDRIGDIEIVPVVYYAPEDVFVEFETVTRDRNPFDRKEFRELCNKYGSLEELKEGLKTIE